MLSNIESSNHFEGFFEHATMGILVTNGDGGITAVNPFALTEFGYSEEELIGKNVEILIPRRFYHKHIHHREKYAENPQKPANGPRNGFVWHTEGWR